MQGLSEHLPPSSSPFSQPTSLLQNHHNPIVHRHEYQPVVEQLVEETLVPPLAAFVAPRVARHVEVSPHGPAEAHDGGRNGEAQASDQHRGQCRGLVLGEVGVRALRAVELVRRGVGARAGCVGCWVTNLGEFALGTGVQAVDRVDEEGGGGGEEDVAERAVCMLAIVLYIYPLRPLKSWRAEKGGRAHP